MNIKDGVRCDLTFEDTVWYALIQTEQLAAGCPAGCEDTPFNCDKDPDDMAPRCREDFIADLQDIYDGDDTYDL